MVAAVTQRFRHGYTTAVKKAPVTEELPVKRMFINRRVSHVTYAGIVGMKPRHKAGPGRTAAGNIVKLGMKLPGGGKSVYAGSIDLPAKAARIGIAHVIREYYYYVRSFTHNQKIPLFF
jgi:hypothetical protein